LPIDDERNYRPYHKGDRVVGQASDFPQWYIVANNWEPWALATFTDRVNNASGQCLPYNRYPKSQERAERVSEIVKAS